MTRIEEMKLAWRLWWAGVSHDTRAFTGLVKMARLAWPSARTNTSNDQAHQDVIDSLAWMTALCAEGWSDSHESALTRDTLDQMGLPRLYYAQVRLTQAILTTATQPPGAATGHCCRHHATQAQLELLQRTAARIHAAKLADLERQAHFMSLHPSAV